MLSSRDQSSRGGGYLEDGPIDDGLGVFRVVFEAVDVIHGYKKVVSRRQQESLGGLGVEDVALTLQLEHKHGRTC